MDNVYLVGGEGGLLTFSIEERNGNFSMSLGNAVFYGDVCFAIPRTAFVRLVGGKDGVMQALDITKRKSGGGYYLEPFINNGQLLRVAPETNAMIRLSQERYLVGNQKNNRQKELSVIDLKNGSKESIPGFDASIESIVRLSKTEYLVGGGDGASPMLRVLSYNTLDTVDFLKAMIVNMVDVR